MTYQTAITANSSKEEPQGFTHSPVSQSFSALLLALRSAVEAEIDSLEADIHSVAFKKRMNDAAVDWRVVYNFVRTVLAQKPARPEDLELHYIASLIALSTSFEHSEDCPAYNLLVRDYSPIIQCCAESPTGQRTIEMIEIARKSFKTLDRAVLGRNPRAETQAVAAK
ncbi:hypothetical protein [Roseovarius aquimarinus]|uniref:Uncharacterized protein n=1 Tax=Roseovarius aquimarinus TaxID=1229156 RepID=A0ABW7I6B1_9RHOB